VDAVEDDAFAFIDDIFTFVCGDADTMFEL